MSNERYQQDLAISLQDFLESGWEEAISQAFSTGYERMWQELHYAACIATDQGRMECGKVLHLLAEACSMMLSPSSNTEPFKPSFYFPDRRSAISDDFFDSDIAFFAEIVDAIDNHWLKARLSDLIWLRQRKPAFALEAIDAYRNLPLDEDTLGHGGQDCWSRAIGLAKNLRNQAGDRLQQMETSIIEAFSATKRDDVFLGLRLAELLKSNGLGKTYRLDVATKLESLAKEFDGVGDFFKAREYFQAASEWYKSIPDQGKAAEMTVGAAESWVKEARAQATLANPSHMVAANAYENAIQTLRIIPRVERSKYQVDERMAQLRIELNVSGELALGEMKCIETPAIDIQQFVEEARELLKGRKPQEALLLFSNLHGGANIEQLRSTVLEKREQFPLQFILASKVISRDGRFIAKRPPMSLGSNLIANDEIAIRAQMIKDYCLQVSSVVESTILPALDVLQCEHQLKERDFTALALRSPIVPKDRAGLFGKALFAGYERDFVTALHLLIPQMEHLVRVHLKEAGAMTTNLDKNGIQNENGMSTLLDLPEAEQVFGKNLAFELKALLCDASGPNLRNELAHGLLNEVDCNSSFSIYAWWLALRLTINTW